MPFVEATRKGTLNRPSSLEAMLRADFTEQRHVMRRSEVKLEPVENSPGVKTGWYEFNNKVVAWSLTEIQPGSAGPMHRQLNESTMWVLQGQGHTLLNGRRIDWKRGDALFVPLFAWHQHVNDGDAPVVYASMNTAPLFYYLGVYRQETLSPPDSWERAEQETGPYGTVLIRREEWLDAQEGWVPTDGDGDAFDFAFDYRIPTSRRIPSRLAPGAIGGMHRHASEAQVFVFQGEGYFTLNDERVDAKEGDVVRVPLYCWHQMVNTGDVPFIFLKNNTAGIYNRLSILMRDLKPNFKDGDISAFKDDFKIW